MSLIEISDYKNWKLLTLPEAAEFNPALLEDMQQSLSRVEDAEDSTGLLITGRGKHFCQGLDMNFLTTEKPEIVNKFVNDCMHMIAELMTLSVPTVAAVNGHAFGLGAMIVMAGDYAVMREDRGYLCLPEINLGVDLIPSMHAFVSQRLSRKQLRDLLLAGQWIPAIDAQSLGLIDQVCEVDNLLDNAIELATPMAGKNRQTMQKLKAGINAAVLEAIAAA